ncbi:MAG: SpoIIE family protein phosphatase [Lentisphaerae bacterium]|nr:SpoIIE family protein phosphatase [Lentisphaerota bacterium]MCP4101795.1 SpoIIE family protein phosphatase [Lentisphaerota bacterium]
MILLEETFIEIECCQRIKTGESVCGDDFRSIRLDDESRCISVLSDGLGSGIKDSLMASMTTSMVLRFVSRDMEIIPSAEIIMDTLPVCEVRKISYATFTVADILANDRVRIIEMDNPPYIHLRDGEDVQWEKQTVFSAAWPDRKLNLSKFKAVPGDRIIFFSDGVTQAGLGHSIAKFGWKRQGCLEFVQNIIKREPNISARDLSHSIVAQACTKNPGFSCIDDISCTVIYFRKPRHIRLLTGPPFRNDKDRDFAKTVLDFNGRSVICGGTTAGIVGRELNREVRTDLRLRGGGLPPISTMKGIDLVTEGILTLTETDRQLELDNRQQSAPLAAAKLIELLQESDVIEFIAGTRVNEAHQDPSLPVDLEIRRNIIKRLKTVLENKYMKKVTIKYY